jgi:type II secretory pathway component PulF
MLDRLAKLTRQQVRIRKAVTSALVYPCLLIGVALSVISVMVGYVLPRFEGLFETLGSSLPPPTKLLMGVSSFQRGNWYFVLGGVASLVTGVIFYLRGERGRRQLDEALVTLPQVGKVTRSFATARIARVLGVLLEGKVPLLEALSLTRHAMSNSLYVHLVSRAEDAVIRGEMLSTALADQRLMSSAVVEALRSGEKSGQLATVLTSIAEHMDEDNEVSLKTLMGLLEPVILLILGLVVGGVAVGMMLPLFDLAAAGQNSAGGG